MGSLPWPLLSLTLHFHSTMWFLLAPPATQTGHTLWRPSPLPHSTLSKHQETCLDHCCHNLCNWPLSPRLAIQPSLFPTQSQWSFKDVNRTTTHLYSKPLRPSPLIHSEMASPHHGLQGLKWTPATSQTSSPADPPPQPAPTTLILCCCCSVTQSS